MEGPGKTALVLSAGGLYGAYQIGAWKSLWEMGLRPDIVVGASIGSLNAWAIGGGATPDALAAMWLESGGAPRFRPRIPRTPLGGLLDTSELEERIRRIHQAFQPTRDVGVVLTDLLKLRRVLFRGDEITWQHLAASCAMVVVFRQFRIGGRIYTDGGFLESLPLSAAVEMGATRIVAVNALPKLPSFVIRSFVKAVRVFGERSRALPDAVRAAVVAPRGPLGPVRDSIVWERGNIERWIAQGEADAAQMEQSLRKMF